VPTPKQRYIKKLNEIAARYGKRENAAVRATWRMLRDLRGRVLAELAGTTQFQIFRLTQMRTSIEQYIAEFEQEAGAEARDALRVAYETGSQSVIEPLREVGELRAGFFTPSPAQLNTVLDYSADLVRGIGDDTRKAINLQLRMTALGQKSSMDAMREITRQFGLVDLHRGREVVKGISYGAERILRTELQRVYNLSSHSQQNETAKQVPGLMKSWVATADSRTRPEHLRAHLEYMANPIPVEEPFIVGGEEAQYPLDPNLSAAMSIHCRCRMITVHPAIGRIGSSLDGRIAAEMKRRKERIPSPIPPWLRAASAPELSSSTLFEEMGASTQFYRDHARRVGDDWRAKESTMYHLGSGLYYDDEFKAFTKRHPELKGFKGRGPTEPYASELVSSWAVTSGDNNPLAIAMQQAVQKEFGLPAWKWPAEGLSEMRQRYSEEDIAALQRFVRVMYNNTQEYLKEQGVEKLWLWRGMRLQDQEGGFGKLSLDLQPASSFSTSYRWARGFSGIAGEKKQVGATLIATEVPRERILGLPGYGWGCHAENELVVLSGKTEAWSWTWGGEPEPAIDRDHAGFVGKILSWIKGKPG